MQIIKKILKNIQANQLMLLINNNFAAIHEIKPVLELNKPIYVGFTV